MCNHILHLRMVINVHLFWCKEIRYQEMMLRLRLNPHDAVCHRNWQIQGADHCIIGHFSIKNKAGYIDAVIDTIGQIHGQFALHRRGIRVYPFALRMYFACQFHVVTVFEVWTYVNLLNIHQHVIHLIINIIESSQACFTTAIFRIACQVHSHRLHI